MFSLLLIAAATAQAATPSPPPDPLAELQKNVLAIEETAPGVYSGPGWEQLIADGAAAQFFVIGEQHMTSDIAQFGIAVHKALAARGYTHAAYEIGPYSVEYAEKLIRSGDGKLAAYIRSPGRALVFPFLFNREEVVLAEQIVALSPDKKHALWGLDQEFAASGPLVVDLLQKRSRTQRQRSAVEDFARKVASAPGLVAEKSWSEFTQLEAAFADDAETAQYLKDLKLSNWIYAPFTGRGGTVFDANVARENYMKKNFARRFAEAESRNGKPPKVFLKFGGSHAHKGFSNTDTPALANFLYEWGIARGFTMSNIMVECSGGLARNPQTQETMPCQPYFNKDAVLAKVNKADRLTLIDLRPLRVQLHKLKGLDADSRRVILSFDYYMAIKDVRPAMPTAPSGGASN